MQVLDIPELMLVGLQAREVTRTGATRLTVAVLELLLRVAVTVALELVVKVPAVTVNVPVVAPDGTRTEAGVVREALLSESVTVLPPLGAA